MSDNRKTGICIRAAAPAIMGLAVVSVPAAATATVALGLHWAYEWHKSQSKGDKGPVDGKGPDQA